jgi:predicted PurR-regulated permease PerM
MLNWLTHIITLPRILAFVLGMIASQVIGWYVNRKRMQRGLPCKSSGTNTVVGVVIVLAMVWIMVATQQARNCALTLNKSLSVEITAGKMEREAFQNAVAMQQNLPPDVRDLDNNDPAKKAAMKPIEDFYFSEVAKATKIRNDNKAATDAAQKACGT